MTPHKNKFPDLCKIQVKYFTLLMLCVFTLGCVKTQVKIKEPQIQRRTSGSAVNINKASAEDLERLPGIGAKTARKIIDHREKFGAFTRPEHLLLVSGISDKRFRQMRHLIRIKGREGHKR